MTADQVERGLRKWARKDKADFLPKYFQAHPGGYGEGDQFLGVMVPHVRQVAREFRNLAGPQWDLLIRSPWHECRLAALFILELKFRKTDASAREQIVDRYLEVLDYVNNWDLVDTSAPRILGVYVLENPKKISVLRELSRSKELWRERVSVLATMPLIHQGDFRETLRVCRQFLKHEHDLIHKACGWLLREIGQVDEEVLCTFLDAHVSKMPRTMLRYAIERLDPKVRKAYLAIPKTK